MVPLTLASFCTLTVYVKGPLSGPLIAATLSNVVAMILGPGHGLSAVPHWPVSGIAGMRVRAGAAPGRWAAALRTTKHIASATRAIRGRLTERAGTPDSE